MLNYEKDDIEFGVENDENLQDQLALERKTENELAIEQDEHPIAPETDELPEKKRLKRELRKEALARLETAARTESDFKNVISWWDKQDANRERRERYHELSRSGGDLPLDCGATEDGLCYPESLNGFLMRQIRKGDFLEAIFFCPYEIHELVTDESLSKIIYDLSEDYKDLLFHCTVLQFSAVRIAQLRGQTDRNIRKTRCTMLKKIQRELLDDLLSGQHPPQELTLYEKRFMGRNKKALLGEGKKG
jgi:hypothetical protein